MSLNNSKEEMSENELSNCKKFLNLDLNLGNKEENNYLPTFLIESLNENEENYFKDDDQLSNEEMNTIDSFNEKNISYNIDYNYKMHSFDDSKKNRNFQFNPNQNFNFGNSNIYLSSNNSLFNNQITNNKQYSFNNKNSNVNRLYQQFFQIPNNYCSQQINPQFHMINNYCMNQMIMNINNNNVNNNINNNINNNFNNKNKNNNKKNKNPLNEKNIDNNSNNNTNPNNISINSLFLFNEMELYSFLTTQKGSRSIQNILSTVSEKEIDIILKKIKSKSNEIMIDKYGNYFFQKLIELCTPKQRHFLLLSIKDHFVEISNNSFGTHPLQLLIEKITSKNEKEVVLKSIENNELNLSLDSKGTHVLQKFISITKDEERLPINKNLLDILPKLINDPFGVCVLIKLIKYTNDKEIKINISKYISDNNALSFIQHPYANYAVQSLFNQNDICYCEDIIKVIVDNFYILSLKKFSSNVVENCIKFGNDNIVNKIYKSIFKDDKLEVLLNNTYGNFVIEKLVSRLNKEEKNKFLKEIEKLGKDKSLSNTIMNLLLG
jgi:hypothetical protein